MPPIERHMPPAPQRTPEIRHVQGGMAVDNFNAYLYEPTECLRTHDDQMGSGRSAASHGCANIYCMQALHQYFGCKMQRGLKPSSVLPEAPTEPEESGESANIIYFFHIFN